MGPSCNIYHIDSVRFISGMLYFDAGWGYLGVWPVDTDAGDCDIIDIGGGKIRSLVTDPKGQAILLSSYGKVLSYSPQDQSLSEVADGFADAKLIGVLRDDSLVLLRNKELILLNSSGEIRRQDLNAWFPSNRWDSDFEVGLRSLKVTDGWCVITGIEERAIVAFDRLPRSFMRIEHPYEILPHHDCLDVYNDVLYVGNHHVSVTYDLKTGRSLDTFYIGAYNCQLAEGYALLRNISRYMDKPGLLDLDSGTVRPVEFDDYLKPFWVDRSQQIYGTYRKEGSERFLAICDSRSQTIGRISLTGKGPVISDLHGNLVFYAIPQRGELVITGYSVSARNRSVIKKSRWTFDNTIHISENWLYYCVANKHSVLIKPMMPYRESDKAVQIFANNEQVRTARVTESGLRFVGFCQYGYYDFKCSQAFAFDCQGMAKGGLAPDNQRIVFLEDGRTLDCATGRYGYSLDTNGERVTDFHSDGTVAAGIVGKCNRAVLFRPENGSVIDRFDFAESPLCVYVDSGRDSFWIGYRSGWVSGFRLSDKKEFFRANNHAPVVDIVAFAGGCITMSGPDIGVCYRFYDKSGIQYHQVGPCHSLCRTSMIVKASHDLCAIIHNGRYDVYDDTGQLHYTVYCLPGLDDFLITVPEGYYWCNDPEQFLNFYRIGMEGKRKTLITGNERINFLKAKNNPGLVKARLQGNLAGERLNLRHIDSRLQDRPFMILPKPGVCYE